MHFGEELVVGMHVERGVVILVLEGWLNERTYEKLEASLAEVFSGGQYRVIVDMGKVEYMSSAGAGALMNAVSQCAENHGRLILANPTAGVREVLDVLNLESVLPSMPSLESALATF